jgi:hypothetical protein
MFPLTIFANMSSCQTPRIVFLFSFFFGFRSSIESFQRTSKTQKKIPRAQRLLYTSFTSRRNCGHPIHTAPRRALPPKKKLPSAPLPASPSLVNAPPCWAGGRAGVVLGLHFRSLVGICRTPLTHSFTHSLIRSTTKGCSCWLLYSLLFFAPWFRVPSPGAGLDGLEVQ